MNYEYALNAMNDYNFCFKLQTGSTESHGSCEIFCLNCWTKFTFNGHEIDWFSTLASV